MFPPGPKPGKFRVLGERDNHYTTETYLRNQDCANINSKKSLTDIYRTIMFLSKSIAANPRKSYLKNPISKSPATKINIQLEIKRMRKKLDIKNVDQPSSCTVRMWVLCEYSIFCCWLKLDDTVQCLSIFTLTLSPLMISHWLVSTQWTLLYPRAIEFNL